MGPLQSLSIETLISNNFYSVIRGFFMSLGSNEWIGVLFLLLLLPVPFSTMTSIQNVTVTVPESVEVRVLWKGTEQGNAFTLTAMVQPG